MSLELHSLSQQYGSVQALRDLTLEVEDGEILAVLGPSGSGKTTLLEMLAGLATPAKGEIRMEGRTLSRPGYALAPEQRNIGFVFQDFALWPHMTVAQTVAFPLTMRKMSQADRAARVEEVLSLVHLDGYGERYPHELSGGQRQRVAIARALAPHPGVVLLDEPMSNLDARLRERMRVQIAEALRHEHVTAVYVTHDRMEALSVADRIAILDAGQLVQLGTPEELYLRPRSGFAASFLGPAALVPARVLGPAEAGRVQLQTAGGVTVSAAAPEACGAGREGEWVLRPEHLRVIEDAAADNALVILEARVRAAAYVGSHWQLALDLKGCSDLDLVCHHHRRLDPGCDVQLAVDPERTWFMP